MHLLGRKNILLNGCELRLIFSLVHVLLNVVAGFLIARRFRANGLQLKWIPLGLSFHCWTCFLASALQILQEIRLICYIQVLILIHTDVRERY